MKTAIAALTLVVALTARAAQAYPHHRSTCATCITITGSAANREADPSESIEGPAAKPGPFSLSSAIASRRRRCGRGR